MARGKADACILCEQVTCTCGKPAKKAAPRKRAPKAEAAVPPVAVTPQPVEQPASIADPFASVPTAKASARAAMKARAARSAGVPSPVPAPPPRDEVMEDAIRACAPIMAPDERLKYGSVLRDTSSDIDQRSMSWKMRRAQHG